MITDEMIRYAEDFSSAESKVLGELRSYCYDHYTDSAMLSGFFQGRVLSLLSHMIRPKAVLKLLRAQPGDRFEHGHFIRPRGMNHAKQVSRELRFQGRPIGDGKLSGKQRGYGKAGSSVDS